MWTGEVRDHHLPGEAEPDRRRCSAAQSLRPLYKRRPSYCALTLRLVSRLCFREIVATKEREGLDAGDIFIF